MRIANTPRPRSAAASIGKRASAGMAGLSISAQVKRQTENMNQQASSVMALAGKLRMPRAVPPSVRKALPRRARKLGAGAGANGFHQGLTGLSPSGRRGCRGLS
jgi:hypothetical protein